MWSENSIKPRRVCDFHKEVISLKVLLSTDNSYRYTDGILMVIKCTIVKHGIYKYNKISFESSLDQVFKKLSLNDVASFVEQLWCLKVSDMFQAY